MLAIEVEFLLGRYAATDFRDRERAEWPPHPERLFSAMVAAAHEAGLGESARAALLWLEQLPPPHIRADEKPSCPLAVTAFVPVNDPTNDLLPQRAERQPRAFPSVVPDVPTVYFLWPEAQPDGTLVGLLATIASNVTYLGSSRSPVRVRLVETTPPANWFPDSAGSTVLRVPGEGRLESLEWHYGNGLRPPAGTFQRYRCGEARLHQVRPEGVYGEMVVYRLRGPVGMEIETTRRLTELLRAAVMRQAQEALVEVPTLLSGHEGDRPATSRPHAAYVALPFVSDTLPHADGRILGVAVVLPRDISPEERRQAFRALKRVDHLALRGLGRFGLERLAAGEDAPHNLREWTWTRPARRWASVTPVVLDRFPKRNGRGLEDIIAQGCEYVGLPSPAEVVADRHSPLHGVEPSSRFLVSRPGQPGRLYTHVTLTFDEPVRGPVLLGAGRHFGLGLLRPLQEEESPEP